MLLDNLPGARTTRRLALAAVCLVLPSACGGGGEATGPSAEPSVATVQLLPPEAATVVGGTPQLEGTPLSSSWLPVSGASLAWSSSDDAVATVDAAGEVTGRALGTATITAESEGVSATATVLVIEEEFVSVTAGGVHSCGVMSDGRAYCWGGNDSGMLGDGTAHSMPTPVPVAGNLTFTALSTGTGAATCGVADDGVARCWGHNKNSELGNGSSPAETCPGGGPCSRVPMEVDSDLRFRWAGALYKHSCALTEDGAAHCWGFNPGGQAGAPLNVGLVNAPTPLETTVRFDAVDGGFNHSCGLSADGKIYCWGSAAFGVKGPGAGSGPSLAVIGDAFTFVDVASGGWHACGVTGDGALYCWGRNHRGQLGAEGGDSCEVQGSVEDCSDVPVRVSGGHTFTAVTAGFDHTCGLTVAGTAYCWGSNEAGQLGDAGADETSMTPIAVSGGHRFVSVDAGRFHTCGVTDGGAAYCWGWGEPGQLGDGRTEDSAVPVRVFGPR